jgi:hypothetical protein
MLSGITTTASRISCQTAPANMGVTVEENQPSYL